MVISIIGILASIVLAALNGARYQGAVSAGVQFADTNYHALGSDALIIYNFNNSGGLTDSSINGYNPTCSGMTFSTDAPAASAGNMSGSFVAGGNCLYTFVGTQSGSLPFFTLTGWIKLSAAAGSNPNLIVIKHGSTNGLLQYNVTNGKFQCAASSYAGNTVLSNTSPQIGKWYNVTCTHDSSSNLTLYVNGVVENSVGDNKNLVWVAGDTLTLWNSDTSTGLLDNVAVYTHSLSDAQVRELYAEGAAKHGLAAK